MYFTNEQINILFDKGYKFIPGEKGMSNLEKDIYIEKVNNTRDDYYVRYKDKEFNCNWLQFLSINIAITSM